MQQNSFALEETKKAHPLAGILKSYPQLTTPLKDGDAVSATLLTTEGQRAYFDIKGRGTGIVTGREFVNAKDIIKGLAKDQEINATVVTAENEDGFIELSLVKALHQQNWQDVKALKDSGAAVAVKITAANTGGLLAELNGIKAFIPVSQLSAQNYPHVEDGDKGKIHDELKKFVGQNLEVRVLDFNPKADKLILSEREVTNEGVRKSLEKYSVGDTVDVVVSGVADFGVFVKLLDDPSVEGLVHISEIDHKLIDAPKEVVKVDDSMKAKIIEIKDGRISLSFKALKPNPWDDAGKYFAQNQEVTGTVVRYNPFGALVALGHDLQGLIHISEFESREKMQEQLVLDKEYPFVISVFKPEEKRIILKLKK
jgi:small subunit ribosomal protein S1